MAKHNRAALAPTPGELKLLKVLWNLGEGTIDDILQASDEAPPPNYKTVQTLLRIMENKKMITHRLRGRAFVFQPRVQEIQVNRSSIRSLLQRHFGGSRTELLINLLDDERIAHSELEELEDLIRRRRQGKHFPRRGKSAEA
jgi:BlaI family transcriptional regulator, penicillinase repressor